MDDYECALRPRSGTWAGPPSQRPKRKMSKTVTDENEPVEYGGKRAKPSQAVAVYEIPGLQRVRKDDGSFEECQLAWVQLASGVSFLIVLPTPLLLRQDCRDVGCQTDDLPLCLPVDLRDENREN